MKVDLRIKGVLGLAEVTGRVSLSLSVSVPLEEAISSSLRVGLVVNKIRPVAIFEEFFHFLHNQRVSQGSLVVFLPTPACLPPLQALVVGLGLYVCVRYCLKKVPVERCWIPNPSSEEVNADGLKCLIRCLLLYCLCSPSVCVGS